MSDNLVPENDLPVSSSNEVPESDLPSTSTPKAQSKTAGAIAGAAIGAPVSSGIAAKQTISAIADAIRKGRAPTPAPTGPVSVSAAPPVPTAAAAAAPELVGNEKWLSKLSGGQTLPGGQMAAEDLAKARDMARAIGPGGPLAGGQNVGGVLLGPKTPAELKAEAAAAREAQIVQEAEKRAAEYLAAKEAEAAAKAAKPTALQTAGKILTPTGVAGKVLNTVAPVLSLAGAGAGAVDAANRWQHGDYGRSIVSGLGAIGSAASMFPHPVTRAVGTGAALLAPAINYGIDTLIGREGYADGGDVGPYVGYPQIKNKPRDPNFVQQSGPFLGGLDAIIGMGPRSDVSMLTPEGQAYHEAYSKMEPVGIAANVLPFIGGPTKALGKSAVRELGPKAADMAENYLARIGGLQYAVPPSNAPAARTLVEPTAEEIARFQAKPTTHGKLSDFLQNHMDEYLGLHQSDRLGTHGDYMGGTGFTNFQNINPLHAKNEVVWMNMTPEASNKIISNTQINGKPVVWSNYIGKTDQHKSNRGVYNEILTDVYKNNPNISPEQAALINARMKAVTGRDLDIRDKFLMQEEGGNTFDARGNLSKMFGEGFGRGKGKTILSPNYQSILNATEEEFTKGAPTSAIGTRLHRVYNEPSQFSTAFHPDYDYTVHGKDLGVQFPAVPHTVLDWTQKYIKEGRGGKGSTLPHGNAWFNYMSNPQHINEPFIKRLQSEGHAEGGSIPGYQVGGKILRAASDLILPAAENAARTQIIGTLPTYGKAAEMLAQRGATGQAIDFGAGLGKGAELLGAGTHTYEPFAQNWKPTFSNAADIPSDAYGRLTNLNVLNVVPREARDEIVENIGRVIQPGGQGIITTRGADVMKAKGLEGPEPMSIITSRDTYQKGFTKQELEDYMRYMLGNKFDVNKINLGPAGVHIQKKAEGGDVTNEPEQTPIISQLIASAKELGHLR